MTARRTIALALLAVLALLAPPSWAALTISGVNQVLVIEKVDQRTRGPELRFSITATATGETGALAMAGTYRSRPRTSSNGFFGYTDISSATAPSSYGFGAPQCGACDVQTIDERTFSVNVQAPQNIDNRLDWWFVASHGTDLKVTIDTPGWRLRTLPKTSFRYVTSDTAGLGVRSGGYRVERFSGATLRGGENGSMVSGVAPCDSAGIGSLTLSGGRQPMTLDCPSTPVGAAIWTRFDVASRAASWKLSGEAAGLSSFRMRLAVIDFPAR